MSASQPQPSISHSERLFPNPDGSSEQIKALSLSDAITVNYLATSAVWFFEGPEQPLPFDLVDHLRQSLRVTLAAYPQWCGRLKAITSVDGPFTAAEQQFAPHARRFGRVYVQYGTRQDPGVEFITAHTTATLEELHPSSRTTSQPLWDQGKGSPSNFGAATQLAHPLKPPTVSDANALPPPIMAIQLTTLGCGGFALAAKIAHPLADASSLVRFVKDWASVSRSVLLGVATPSLTPVFEPERLDAFVAGDVNAATADESIIQRTEDLPFHRYDWWNPCLGYPQAASVPEAFQGQEIPPAGKPIPWSEWDTSAPVSHYVLHLSHDQVEAIWQQASDSDTHLSRTRIRAQTRLSRHDAVLAHIWASINRARRLQNDGGPVHCDLTYGFRPAFQLDDAFMGNANVMVNVEMTGAEVTTTVEADGRPTAVLPPIAQRIRQTLTRVRDPTLLAAHLHRLAYETSPQRIWQGFLGDRHIMVTTWARAGLYEVDFGLGPLPTARYADGLLANLDGLLLIKEAPPGRRSEVDGQSPPIWTEYGVDVQLHLRTEVMDRLIQDPALLSFESFRGGREG
ncbi:transferase family protein [Aspergillus ellipticus CBS 707.79]|uniref:Transferase family protein n=1 Tax=Aspergillus ellipticus CBS 707.79 TaxID=1448320 RepID=A0A319DTX5_9EURO|nr:transferase family protein [Aspergillus ellipticus CBS 707.79]